jgi:NAD(P)-dependent dehydrogenase (short-subunit alcohol dehydrogenase family)
MGLQRVGNRLLWYGGRSQNVNVYTETAAVNHLVITLSNEEQSVTSIAVRPGVVDTEMQREIREYHSTVMDQKDAERFRTLKDQDGLLKPEQPGHVIAKLALDAPKEFSGKFLT